MSTLKSTKTVIEQLGGTAEVARLTGHELNTVGNWRLRDFFPAPTYIVLTAALTLKGKTADARLWKMIESPQALLPASEAGSAKQ